LTSTALASNCHGFNGSPAPMSDCRQNRQIPTVNRLRKKQPQQPPPRTAPDHVAQNVLTFG